VRRQGLTLSGSVIHNPSRFFILPTDRPDGLLSIRRAGLLFQRIGAFPNRGPCRHPCRDRFPSFRRSAEFVKGHLAIPVGIIPGKSGVTRRARHTGPQSFDAQKPVTVAVHSIKMVQGYRFEGYDRAIDSHVKNLRKKIAERLPGEEIIQTIYGMGNKLSV
jgi:hypothetical protein